MSGWRVTAWSKDARRGEIESAAGRLPFDGGRAAVDDFTVGEAVEIELRRSGDDAEVTRLWPRDYRSELPGARPVERLDALLGESPLYQLRLHGFADERLELHVVHGEWPPPHRPPLAVAVFEDVALVHLPRVSDLFRRAQVAPWDVVVAERRALARRLGDPDNDPGAQLFAFEPAAFAETAGYVIARTVRVAVPG